MSSESIFFAFSGGCLHFTKIYCKTIVWCLSHETFQKFLTTYLFSNAVSIYTNSIAFIRCLFINHNVAFRKTKHFFSFKYTEDASARYQVNILLLLKSLISRPRFCVNQIHWIQSGTLKTVTSCSFCYQCFFTNPHCYHNSCNYYNNDSHKLKNKLICIQLSF